MSIRKFFEGGIPQDIADQIEEIKAAPYTNGRHITFKNGYKVSVQWGIGLHDGVDLFERLTDLENELPPNHSTEQYFHAYFNVELDAPMAEMMVIAPDES